MKRMLVLGVLAAACASGKSTFNSAVDLKAAPALSRVFVVARMKNTGFNEKVYQGFEKGMRARFADCRVETLSMHIDDMDLDPEKRFEDARAKFRPDAVLVIRQAGGSVILGRGGTNSDLILEMQFFDSRTKKAFWHAKTQLSLLTNNMYVDDGASGEKFATDTVARLKTDGLLHDCKEPAPEKEASAAPAAG